MKKILIFMLMCLMLISCSNDSNEEGNKDNPSSVEQSETETKVYQIGETAVITSNVFEFDYEVTVTDFQLTTEVDGVTIEEFILGADDTHRFAVVDVTIKNITDESIIPHRQFSANFGGEQDLGGKVSNDEFFPEGEEVLEPGQEVKGHLVYTTTSDYAANFILKYEMSSDQETHFILPNPER
jgi:hypothetical protein